MEAVKLPGTAKEFLETAFAARTERVNCEYRLEKLQKDLERFTTKDMNNPKAEFLLQMHDKLLKSTNSLFDDLNEKIIYYWNICSLVSDKIDKITDYRFRMILRLRYLDGMAWGDVWEDLRHKYGIWYEERQLFRFHKKALAELQNVLDTSN